MMTMILQNCDTMQRRTAMRMAISQAGMKGLSTYIASSRRDPWCTNSLSCQTKS